MLAMVLFFIPVLMAGLLAAVNILPRKGAGTVLLSFLLLAMVSSIQLNTGYRDVHVDLTVFILFTTDLSLLVHLVLKSKLQSLPKHQGDRYRLGLVGVSLAMLLIIMVFQGFALNIFDSSLYIYHLNLELNVLLLAFMFYLLGVLQISTSTILRCIVGFSVLNSLLGVLQYITNKSLLLFSAQSSINYYEGARVAKRAIGFVGASNGAGNLAAIFFPVLLYYFMKKRSLFSIAAALLNGLFLFLTFTRIGYLSVCVQFLIFLLYARMGTGHQLLKRLGAIMAAAFAAILVYQIFYDELYQMLFVDRGNTESHRFIQFSGAFQILKEHMWFGLGAGQYVPYMQAYHGIDDIALHSQFLNMLVEQGLFGFAFFLLVYVSLFVWTLKKYKGDGWFPVTLFLGNLIVVNFNPNQYYSLCIYTFFIIAYGLVFGWREDAVHHTADENGPMEGSKCPKPKNQIVNIMQMNEGACNSEQRRCL
ncbi:hypothetical protein GRF59_08560 [Paenibacillus sp. HJL G12]|uniref:O-antigen ligase-related domain-containing protein n=1 Tax=Paenibacillus dendrobii TaxID=2691084 RepID=A0A7X3LG33_9BACL|nr:O-antigen ligase family protein [Paenibacillus dendrobii]MWV43687.1 hypothetical protein [Paenibacillus dendrobii]